MIMALKKGDKIRKGKYVAPEVFEGRKLTKTMFEEIIYKYMNKTQGEIFALIKEPGQTPAIELMVINIMARAIGKGDTMRSEFLLRRSIGAVVDKVEVKTEDTTTQKQTDDLAKKLIEALKK
jgi:hypothetical protein